MTGPALAAPPQQAPPQHFSLRWNDYKSSLVTAFDSLRSDAALLDVTLCCNGGHRIGAHRLLLSACSPYFREILSETHCRHPFVVLRDTRKKDLEAILEFIYNGEVSIEDGELDSFLKVAASLQIRGLTEDDHGASAAAAASAVSAAVAAAAAAAADEAEVEQEAGVAVPVQVMSTPIKRPNSSPTKASRGAKAAKRKHNEVELAPVAIKVSFFMVLGSIAGVHFASLYL